MSMLYKTKTGKKFQTKGNQRDVTANCNPRLDPKLEEKDFYKGQYLVK